MARFIMMGLLVTGGVQQNLRLRMRGVTALLISVLLLTATIRPTNKKVFPSGVLRIDRVYRIQDLSFITLIPPAILVTLEKPFCVRI
jgi:hypothetical protein